MKHRGRLVWTGLLCALVLSAPLLADDEPTRLDQLSQELQSVVEKTKPSVVAIDGGVPGEFEASGVIVDPSGVIITCARAIRRTGTVTVQLSDGHEFVGTIIARDAVNDLAIIKIEVEGLQALEFSKVPHHIGQTVITVGNAFGSLDADRYAAYSVGVVSGIYRISDGYRGYVLETDCAINPGSYGGPLLDTDGRILGVVNRSYEAGRWLGTCVPGTQIEAVLPFLQLGAQVRHGYLGLQFENTDAGLRLVGIAEDSPNRHLVVGDVLVEADGVAMTATGGLQNFLVGLPAGSSFPVRLQRAGQAMRQQVHVGLRAGFASALPEQAKEREKGWVGLSASTSAQPAGCRIDGVALGSPAEAAGLLSGDVIVACQNTPVASLEDVLSFLRTAREGDVLVVDLLREGFERRSYVTLGRKPEVVATRPPAVEPGPAPVAPDPQTRPWLGMALVENSLRVSAVAPGGPAELAGFRPGDEILAISKAEGAFLRVNGQVQLRDQIQALGSVGEALRFRISRGGYEQVLLAVLTGPPGEAPTPPQVAPAPQARPWLGASLEESEDFFALTVLSVVAGGPADRAGLRSGDLLFEVNGQEVGELDGLRAALERARGSEAELTILRNRRLARLAVQLGTAPEEQDRRPGFLGIALVDGLVIDDVLPDSPADRAGLRLGDQILRVAGRQLTSIEDFSRAMNDFNAGQQVEMLVARNGTQERVQVTLAAREEQQNVPAPGPQAEPRRAFLGVTVDDGLGVASVVPGSAADKAGLLEGDVILAIAGNFIDDRQGLIENLQGRQVGEQLQLRIRRGNAVMELDVVLGTRPEQGTPAPEPEPAPAPTGRAVLGVRLNGLELTGVSPGSGAASAGLQAGDRLAAIDGKTLENVEALRAGLAGKRPGDVVQIEVVRSHQVVLGDYEGRPVMGVTLEGLNVVRVLEGSGAEAGGIAVGDVITSINGQALADMDALRALVGGLEAGSEVSIAVQRSFDVVMGSASEPAPTPQVDPAPAPPVKPAQVSLGVRLSESMQVLELRPGGPAEQAGMRVGDTLRNLDREVVESLDDMRRVLADAEPGQKLKFIVTGADGETRFGTVVARAPGETVPAPQVDPAPPAGRPSLGLKLSNKMVVLEVAPAGPFAGVAQPGWTLQSVADQPTPDFASLRAALEGKRAGDEIACVFVDGDTVARVRVVLGRPAAPGGQPSSYISDCSLFYVDQPLVSGFLGVSLQDEAGAVTIVTVIEDTAAERLGLRVGDIFASVGGEKVAVTADLIQCIKQIAEGDTINFEISRGGEVLSFEAELGRRPEGM